MTSLVLKELLYLFTVQKLALLAVRISNCTITSTHYITNTCATRLYYDQSNHSGQSQTTHTIQ